MALVTTLKFVITWGIANLMFLVITPLIKTLRYDTGMWNLMPPSMLAWGDQLYVIWIAQIIIVPAIIIVTSWREAERKATGVE